MVKKIVLIGSIALALTGWLTFGISVFAPSPAAAEPRCENWDVSRGWMLVQGNHYTIDVSLTQAGTKLSGTVNEWIDRGKKQYPVKGSLIGNSIKLETGWGGVYIGKIDDTGRIDGTTYDKKDSKSSSTWYSTTRMECLEVAKTQEPQSKEKTGLSLGRVQKPSVGLGRVQQTDPKLAQPDPPICANARSARARNSPAAPGLEAQCRAAGGSVEQPKKLGRIQQTDPKIEQPDPPICARARSARARNSPAAPNLEAQCRAAGGTP